MPATPSTSKSLAEKNGCGFSALSQSSVTRDAFEAKAKAWYYAEVLKDARKSAGITQQELADKIGKKREYIASLEKGETDMQLSTFILISEAVGLKFALTY